MNNKSTTNNFINKDINQLKLSKVLEENIQLFKQVFVDDVTIKYRVIENRNTSKVRACLIFADGMVDKIRVKNKVDLKATLTKGS